MWDNRVIVPTKLLGRVLETLHEGHMGTVKMKGLARGYVWWPRMDEDIESVTRKCEGCQGVANNPKQAPLHRWEYPAKPSSFARCVEVPTMRNSVLSAFSFNLQFFIQRETYWRQSLSWFRERQVSGVVRETDVCVSSA